MCDHPYIVIINRLACAFLVAGLCSCSGTRIRDAAERGDVATVKRMLAKDPKLVDASDFGPGERPITLAAYNGHRDVVEVLLAAGAETRNVMYKAASKGHTNVIALLWDKGGPAMREPAVMAEAFVRAADTGQIPAVAWFVAHGVDINIADKDRYTALGCAAYRADLAMVKWLHVHGAQTETRGSHPWTALFNAVSSDSVPVTELLLKLGADVNATAASGSTPLMRAVWSGQLPMVKLLVQHGADVNVHNRTNNTALILAIKELPPYNITMPKPHHEFVASKANREAEAVCWPIVQLLLERGADVTVQNKDNETAYTLATNRGWQKVAAAVRPKPLVVAPLTAP